MHREYWINDFSTGSLRSERVNRTTVEIGTRKGRLTFDKTVRINQITVADYYSYYG